MNMIIHNFNTKNDDMNNDISGSLSLSQFLLSLESSLFSPVVALLYLGSILFISTHLSS